jgi:hypothetical protein
MKKQIVLIGLVVVAMFGNVVQRFQVVHLKKTVNRLQSDISTEEFHKGQLDEDPDAAIDGLLGHDAWDRMTAAYEKRNVKAWYARHEKVKCFPPKCLLDEDFENLAPNGSKPKWSLRGRKNVRPNNTKVEDFSPDGSVLGETWTDEQPVRTKR